MKLIARLFPKAAELEAASKRIEELEIEKNDLKRKNANLCESINQRNAAYQTQNKELADLKGKLREQTDADLLVVSARIAIKILQGDKPAAADLAMQHNLLQQQPAYAAQYQSPLTYGNVGLLIQGLGPGITFR